MSRRMLPSARSKPSMTAVLNGAGARVSTLAEGGEAARCALVATGHAAAAPPRRVINSRRPSVRVIWSSGCFLPDKVTLHDPNSGDPPTAQGARRETLFVIEGVCVIMTI